MEYNVEEVSPVKRKISISVSPDEVNAAIAGSVALYKDSARLDGFRKGKAPASVVEKKFHTQIYEEAQENLINVHINEVLQKTGLKPISGINMEGEEEELKKGQEFKYAMEFEILPQFDLPPYEGLSVEEEESVVDEKTQEELFRKLREENGKLIPVSGNAPAKDGQVANIDFQAFENGEPIKDIDIKDYDLELGRGEALPDFEALVKEIPVGETKEGEIKFPDDFLSPTLAGKTVTMKVTVHSVKELELPPLDDNLAKKIGFTDMEKLKELIGMSYLHTLKTMNKSSAQKRLLDQMLKMVDFPLPSSLVDIESRMFLTDMAIRLDEQGRSLKSLGKSPEELRADIEPQAKEMARSMVLLMSIANKEGLEITDEEVAKDIYNNCIRKGEDFKSTFENLRNTGMIFHLKDRMLADKAMDLVYAKANVTMVPPNSIEAEEDNNSAQGEKEIEPAEKEIKSEPNTLDAADIKESDSKTE